MEKLSSFNDKINMLLVLMEYDQSRLKGPPFSVSIESVTKRLNTNAELLESREITDLPQKFSCLDQITEKVYYLNS